MKKLFYFLLALPLVFAACDNTPEPGKPEPGPKPQPEGLTFAIEIGEVTHSTVSYTVTPSDLEAEYLCVLYDAETYNSFTREEFLVQTLIQELKTDAYDQGKTFMEYMPEVVDKGVIADKFERLAPESEYYIIVFGVDATKEYSACTGITKAQVTTLEAPKIDISFEINTTVEGNNAQYHIIPSDQEAIWYFYTMPKATYDDYTDPAGDQKMDDTDFILFALSKQIESLRAEGYTDNEILNALFHKGTLTLVAKSLLANTEYIGLVAAFNITEAGDISIASDVTTDVYSTKDVAQSDLTFDLSVTDVEAMRAAIKIVPSNNNDTFFWLVGLWDGQQTAEDIMNATLAQYAGWFNAGMMLYKGVQDYTGGPGSPYKFKLDAADTDYFVIVFGYAGGVTTEPQMVTFHSLPAPAAEDTTFTMSATNITPYSFDISVVPSESTTYWNLNICLPEEYDEETIIESYNAYFDEIVAAYKEYDPNTPISQILGSNFYRGSYSNIGATGLLPETNYVGYVMALDPNTGYVAKLHKFENLATTKSVGSVTPGIELVGYYSGDEENGSVFGQPEATQGKAITVVKYTNLEGARTLFTTMVQDDITNSLTYSDSEVWGLAAASMQPVKVSQPYSFYVAEWNVIQTALAYAVDNNGLPGGFGRLYTMPTADNKGDIQALKTLVDELNAAAKQSFALPHSVVFNEGVQINFEAASHEVVEAMPLAAESEVEADVDALNPNVVVGGSYIRPFYI